MQVFFWVVDLLLPCSMVIMGVYNRFFYHTIEETEKLPKQPSVWPEHWEKGKKLGAVYLMRAGFIFIGYAIVVRLFLPIKPEIISIVNNLLYMAVFVCIMAYVEKKIKE